MTTAQRRQDGIVYEGKRGSLPGEIWVWFTAPRFRGIRVPLPLRLDLFNHSPLGYEWGYLGSGPSQLALAILAHATKSDKKAMLLHHDFKEAFIAGISREVGSEWRITRQEVLAWVAKQEAAAEETP
jgi:hypothetical protein